MLISRWNHIAFLAMWTLFAFVVTSPASAQQGLSDRTLAAAEMLAEADWTELENGIDAIGAKVASGTVINAYRFAFERFRFSIGVQDKPTGERAKAIGKRTNATFVINAGFFSEGAARKLSPVGLLSASRARSGRNWRNSGGYLVLSQTPEIRPTRKGPPNADTFIQSKPLLIEPGKKWAMNTNQAILKRRSLVCLRDGEAIIVAISGTGLSLFDAGWLLRSAEVGGFFDCDSAIAMDGGGSTQYWMRDAKDHRLTGLTPVHNFLLVHSR